MSSSDIQVVEVDAHHCCATWRNLLVTVWRKDTQIDAVKRVEASILRLQDAHPDGVGVIMIVEEGASMPSDAARAAVTALIDKVTPRLIGCGYVFEGDGFAAAVVRYVIIGMTMLGRPGYRYTIVKTIKSVAVWMSARTASTDVQSSVLEIEQAIARIRLVRAAGYVGLIRGDRP